MREEITALWLTDEVHRRAPAVLDEVRNGLYYFEQSLWDVGAAPLPRPRGRAGRVLPGRGASTCPPSCASAPGSAATATATRTSPPPSPSTRCACTRRRPWRSTSATCDELQRHLSVRQRTTAAARPLAAEPGRGRGARCPTLAARAAGHVRGRALPPQARRSCARACARRGALQRERAARSAARRTSRRGPASTRTRCGARASSRRGPATPRRLPRAPAELRADLALMARRPARAGRAPGSPTGALRDLRAGAEVFGFHLARLDLRQHSRVHAEAVAEVLRAAGVARGLPRARRGGRARRCWSASWPSPRPLRAPRDARARRRPRRRWTSSTRRARLQAELGPRGLRRLHRLHDRGRQRPPGAAAASPRRPGSSTRPRRRRRAQRPAGRAAVRDHRRPAPLRRPDARALRAARLPPPPRGLGRPAADHARLLGQQQGRRLRHRELGAVPGAARAGRGLPRARASRLLPLPRPRRRHRARRRADQPRHPGPAAGARWTGGCA